MNETPSTRIVGELRRRIVSGELAPGDRLPSTRQITAHWGVAMATATKVLTALRHEGLIEAVPGVGTVVRPSAGPAHRPSAGPAHRPSGDPAHRPSGDPAHRPTAGIAHPPDNGPAHPQTSGTTPPAELPPPGPAAGFLPDATPAGERAHPRPDPPRRQRRTGETPLSRERVVAAAIRIADTDGMADLSMRRVAADLGVATMALYRYVPSKDDLVILMLDEVFGNVRMIPDPEPVGWRARLESIARLQWAIYQQHGWMAAALSFSRPQLVPRGMVHTEYAMAALHEAGLTPAEYLHAAVCLFNQVRSMAMVFEEERRAEQDTGVSADEWMEHQDSYYGQILATGQFPMMATVSAIPGDALNLESMFEFHLTRYLDGLGMLISQVSGRTTQLNG